MSIHMQAVARCLGWIRREMLPSPDGMRGVYERVRINLNTNSWWVRPDCRIGAFLLRLQHANGAIRNADDSCRHASLQTEPDLTDLVYTDGYALLALQEAYQATGEPRFREAADRLADFLVRVQCRGESPRWDGGWRGAYDVNTLEPRGRADQENPLDEGGMYSVYTGWCAAPITYGLLRRELWRS